MTYPVGDDPDGLAALGAFEEGPRAVPAARRASWRWARASGQSADLRELVAWVVKSVEIPTVLDADALNNLAGQTEILADARSGR